MKKFLFFFAALIFIQLHVAAQNTGIGTLNPQARLHVADSSVLFTGPAALPASPGIPPVNGAGTRMMWYSRKAAFRVGQVSGTDWNEASIGLHSFAAGYNTRALGQYAVALGNGSDATGIGSFSMGNRTTASGQYATALGQNTTASSFGSLALGRYNILSGSGSAWNETDPLFVVGNGYETVENDILTITRRNAFLIKKNADAEISGNTTIKKSLTINDSLIAQGGAGITGNAIISGFMGIGNTSPIVTLDINGALGLRQKNVLISADDQVIDVGNASFIVIRTAGDQRFRNITLGPPAGGHGTAAAGQLLIIAFLGPFGAVNMNGIVGISTNLLTDNETMMYIHNGVRWAKVAQFDDN